jgi:hypothetical protein
MTIQEESRMQDPNTSPGHIKHTYLIYFCWLKQINQMIWQQLNFKCSFEDFIAVDDNMFLFMSSENLCNDNSGG